MVLKAQTRISQNPNGRTQMIVVPSAMVTDSQYPFKAGQEIEIVIKGNTLEVHVAPSQRSVKKNVNGGS